jgi:hypothetical protein
MRLEIKFSLLTLVLSIVFLSPGAAPAIASGGEESEEEQQEQEVEVQQQEEECFMGPSTIKRLMGNESNSNPLLMDLYNDAIRTEEIKTYIAENVDEFDIPDWMYGTDGNTTGTFCLIAGGMVEQEKGRGAKFEGSDLDDNIELQIITKQGDIISNILKNPVQ